MNRIFNVSLTTIVFTLVALLGTESYAGLLDGKPAPDITVNKYGGGTLSLKSFKGNKGVILNFWATWCAPCKAEMPVLNKVAKTRSDIEVLGVNFQQSEKVVTHFKKKYPLDFTILLDEEGEMAEVYRVMGLPVTYFINKNGVVVETHLGILTQEKMDELLMIIN